jgi:hypothetical protein
MSYPVQKELRGRTFSKPNTNKPGNGRATIQFGTCYNYATDNQGRKPGEFIHKFVLLEPGTATHALLLPEEPACLSQLPHPPSPMFVVL